MIPRFSLVLLSAIALAALPEAADAQMFFEADWVYFERSNAGSAPLISGPSAQSSSANYGFQPGYRLQFGGSLSNYEAYAMFTQVDQWNSGSSATLPGLFILDDSAVAGNTLAFPNSLFDAASSTSALNDESTEVELLQPGQTFQTTSSANFRDFEINIGSSRNARNWRLAAGYRHIRLDDNHSISLSGVFDAIDSDDGSVFGDINNDPNDMLSDGALTEAGLTLVSGTGDGFDAFDTLEGIDTVTYVLSGGARNELNGGQATFGFTLLENEYVTLEGIGKAGIYRNQVSGELTEVVGGSGDDDSVYGRTFSDQKYVAAFAGTVGGRAVISLTDYINFVAGYEVLFLANVASGAEQTAGLGKDALGNTVYSVKVGNDVIHGGTAGLEITW